MSKKPLIYLCVPVTPAPDLTQTLDYAAQWKTQLQSAGYRVIAPSDWPKGLDDELLYMGLSLTALQRSDKVLKLPGARHSKGCRAELALADKLGIPVVEPHYFTGQLVQGELCR